MTLDVRSLLVSLLGLTFLVVTPGCPALLTDFTAEYCGDDSATLEAPPEGCRRAVQTNAGSPTPGADAVPAAYDICEGERWNRSQAGSCALCYEIQRCRDPGEGNCATDLDCGSGAVCGSSGYFGCECIIQCTVDDDCGDGFACLCPATDPEGLGWTATRYPKCLPAGCRTNADCGVDGECGVAFSACGDVRGLQCRNNTDECTGDRDCEEETGDTCQFHNEDRRFVCAGDAICD